MIEAPVTRGLRAVGAFFFVLAVLIPTLAILRHAAPETHSANAKEYLFSERITGLTLKTVVFAAVGSVMCLALSIPGAVALSRGGFGTQRLVLLALMASLPLLPPMVLAFGWQRLWGRHAPGVTSPWHSARLVWVWATWLWPIAAFILAAGWSRVGKSAFEASILETRPLVAAFKTVIPAMRVFVVSGVVVTFSLFLGEYTVPHANGVSVVSTEALVLADSGDVLGILGVSLPVTLVAAICAIAVWRKRGKVSWVGADGRMRVGRQGATPWHGWGILALTVGAPLIPLFWRWTLFSEMVEAFRVYGVELATSAALCLGAGAVAVCIGIFVASLGRWASVAVIVVIMFGLVPGAVTGVGVLTAYRPTGWVAGVPALPSVMGWIYDSWGIVVLGLGGRYAWVALVCSFAAIRADGPTLDEQASVDGSGASARLGMKLRGHWRVLAAGLWISTALSFSDVAVGSIVETPSTPMVGKILIEKYHRFETGMLVSLSLLCVLMTIPGALLIAWLMRRRVA